MKKVLCALMGLSFAAMGTAFTAAQESSEPGMSGPPAVIQVQREFLKPGKAGALHDRSESNFVQAMAHAKWPTHYFAVNSLSGPSRALYFTGYPSFDAWEKDRAAMDKNTELTAALERAEQSDGELLSSFDEAVLQYDADLSYHPPASLGKVHFLEITVFKVHPGHGMDFRNLTKMYVDGIQKAGIEDANWVTFEMAYGGGDEYVVISTDKSMADIDKSNSDGKKFMAALGEDGMKKFSELEAASVVSVDSELFAINPKQSYPWPAWVNEDPSFWNAKPVMASVAKPATAKEKKAK
ncbi:MAG TPA: hypothetical protein VF730_15625 [Terracidiphilus sp.]